MYRGVWGGHIPQHFPQTARNDFKHLRRDFPHFPQTARHNDFNDLRGNFPHFPQSLKLQVRLIPPPLGRF